MLRTNLVCFLCVTEGKKELNNKKFYVTALSLYDAFLWDWKSIQFRKHSWDFRDLQASEKKPAIK